MITIIKSRKKLIFLSSIFFSLTVYSQNPEKKLGSWYMYNGNNKISESFSIKTSAHIRYFELAEFYQQEVYRAGLTYNVDKNFNFTSGMVYSIKENNYKSNSDKTYEYRFYEDFNLKTTYGKLQFKHRIRLEHSTNNATNFKKFNNRIRFGVTLQYPLYQKLDFYVFDEIFLNFKSEAFGENRTGAGFIYTISNSLKFQLGYMHIHFAETHLDRLQIGLLINTNLCKKNS
ncbi:DUF2490 domain-containing protein [Polaribacter sp.]|nr:DUF2490 domain-containing protein [Polaribacter sp.]